MKLTSILILSALTFSTSLFAANKGGVFIEPLLSYQNSDFKVDYPSPLGDSDGTITGPGIGGKIGIHIYESFLIGIDGRYSRVNFTDDDNNYDASANLYNVGPTAILQLPTDISLRLWATLITHGQMDPEKENNFDVEFTQASGRRVGAGIMLGTLSLNLEYQTISYDKTKLESVGQFNSSTSFDNVELTDEGYVMSISFPYTL
tara:strand:+ start:149393 stop:150004 length:612 start_codon:yes stop_codon:yes gene_type:complete